jgi:hypothetical protein
MSLSVGSQYEVYLKRVEGSGENAVTYYTQHDFYVSHWTETSGDNPDTYEASQFIPDLSKGQLVLDEHINVKGELLIDPSLIGEPQL